MHCSTAVFISCSKLQVSCIMYVRSMSQMRVADEPLQHAALQSAHSLPHCSGSFQRDIFHLSSLTRKLFLSEYLKTRESQFMFDITHQPS